MVNIDLFIFSLVNKLPGRSKILDALGAFFARYFPFVLVLALLTVAVIQKDVNLLFVPLAVGGIARGMNQIIFVFYQRQRPFEALSLAPLTDKPKYPAFPSSHSAFFFALSFTLLLFSYQLALYFIISSCFIVIARVYCRLHWPLDIVAGALVGYLSFLLATSV